MKPENIVDNARRAIKAHAARAVERMVSMEQQDRDLLDAVGRITDGAYDLRKSGRLRLLYKRTAEGQYVNTGTAFTSAVAAYAWLLEYIEGERAALRVMLESAEADLEARNDTPRSRKRGR